MDITILPGQTVFAYWKDGYYYPAIVNEILEQNIIEVAFLDGILGLVSSEQIVELQEAFQIMQLQGNFKNNGVFYKGRLKQESMTMYYNDGDIEQVELKQLRGARPGEPMGWKQAAGVFAVGVAVGLAICGMCKVRKRRGRDRDCCC